VAGESEGSELGVIEKRQNEGHRPKAGPAVLGRTLSWREDAFVNEPLAKVDAVLKIDLQCNDSGPAARRPAHQHPSLPAKNAATTCDGADGTAARSSLSWDQARRHSALCGGCTQNKQGKDFLSESHPGDVRR